MRSRKLIARFVQRLVCAMLVAAGACSGAAPADSRSYTKIDDMEGAGARIDWLPPGVTVPGIWFSAVDCPQDDLDLSVAERGRSRGVDPWRSRGAARDVPGRREYACRPPAHAGAARRWVGGQHDCRLRRRIGEVPASVPCEELTARAVSRTGDRPQRLVRGSRSGRVRRPAGRCGSASSSIDRNTDPRGGICNAADPADVSQCYNQFGAWISLTDEFKRYDVVILGAAAEPGLGLSAGDGPRSRARVFRRLSGGSDSRVSLRRTRCARAAARRRCRSTSGSDDSTS